MREHQNIDQFITHLKNIDTSAEKFSVVPDFLHPAEPLELDCSITLPHRSCLMNRLDYISVAQMFSAEYRQKLVKYVPMI